MQVSLRNLTINTVVGIALIIAAAAYGIMALLTLDGPTKYDVVGEAGMPATLALFLALIGCGLVYQGLRTGRTDAEGKAEADDRIRSGATITLVILAMVAYGLLLPWVGFILLTPFLVYLLLYISEFRRPLPAVMVSAGLTVIVWLVFQKGLGVLLPNGHLPFFSTL